MQTAATSKDGRTAKGTEVINKNQRESIPAIAKKVRQEGTQLNIERIANALYSRDNPINMKVRFRRFYMKIRQIAE